MARKEFHQELSNLDVKASINNGEREFLGTIVRFMAPHPCAGKVGVVDKIVTTAVGRRPFVRFEDHSWAVVLNHGDAEVVIL